MSERSNVTVVVGTSTTNDTSIGAKSMMFQKDHSTIVGVVIHGRRWTVRVTPIVLIVPTNVDEGVTSDEYFAARRWFVEHQTEFDLMGLV
jgi:hypothetical protein